MVYQRPGLGFRQAAFGIALALFFLAVSAGSVCIIAEALAVGKIEYSLTRFRRVEVSREDNPGRFYRVASFYGFGSLFSVWMSVFWFRDVFNPCPPARRIKLRLRD